MVVYVCCKCLFSFMRSGEVDRCPDCGSVNVRHATSQEAAEYERNKAECQALPE